MNDPMAYGKVRKNRPDVSYRQIEDAANDIWKAGYRPTVARVRAQLQGGSPLTVLNGLQRYWKEVGARLLDAPDPRRHLPAAVADAAENLWQAALSLSIDAAAGRDTALKTELAQLRIDVESRVHALSQREIELDSWVTSRERTIRELEEHLRATIGLIGKRDTTIHSLETRLVAAQAETDTYRKRLATVIGRAASLPKVVPRSDPSAGQGGRRHRTSARPKSAQKVVAKTVVAGKKKRRR